MSICVWFANNIRIIFHKPTQKIILQTIHRHVPLPSGRPPARHPPRLILRHREETDCLVSMGLHFSSVEQITFVHFTQLTGCLFVTFEGFNPSWWLFTPKPAYCCFRWAKFTLSSHFQTCVCLGGVEPPHKLQIIAQPYESQFEVSLRIISVAKLS